MNPIEPLRPDSSSVLAGLKDFQRATVDYVFRRMYLDADCVRRFLVADEVGLGKTLVARGVIAKAIDHLWEQTGRIDVVYVCSNTDIARQNINRLNVTGCEDFSLSSRITLLPVTVRDMQHRRVNFISFTPGTSFDLKDSAGMSMERELLFWLLQEPWSLSFKRATRVLHVYAEVNAFRERVEKFPERHSIDPMLRDAFIADLQSRQQLREKFERLLEEMPRPGIEIPDGLRLERNQCIGELRRLLAQTCLHWLEPDLIILDEFQRFKHLLQGDAEGASEAAQLAEHLFNFQQSEDDPATAARVLLLSATPYKMYTQSHETEQDDHYADFKTTLDFLIQDAAKRDRFHSRLQEYRRELFRLADQGVEELVKIKSELESSLREVMVRTERLALKADRNGMLAEVSCEPLLLKSSDLQHYLGLQGVAEYLGHDDLLEYWKSAPYLLNFMEEYDFKRKFKQAIDAATDKRLMRAVRSIGSGLLSREEIEKYQRIDPANARLRSLHNDLIGRGAWRLLWIPPSLPYYEGVGPFTDPQLEGITKRLVFSCWKVVPKAIAAVLSYEAERHMMQCFRKKAQNTVEARKRRRGLLRFTFSKGRPTGMPVMSMLYPSRTLADRFDPLKLMRDFGASGQAPTLDDLLNRVQAELADLLGPIMERFAGGANEAVDESWYWAAPLLLDLEYGEAEDGKWLARQDLARIWGGEKLFDDRESAGGWSRHVQLAQELVRGRSPLGKPPAELPRVLALLAIAGPGVVSLRALERILPERTVRNPFDTRSFAGPLAHAFLRLFNLPEVMHLLRDRKKEIPYWYSVLEYCAAGNLQAVLDEYAHLLVESLGLIGSEPSKLAKEVSKAISDCLMLRTSTAQADIVATSNRRIYLNEPIRMRTRFAMRFGDQDAEDSVEPTRADHVRNAFNSPFWPFVLATTSVGQEGLDFHPYCHAVMHWNLPSNPVDLEQREGRVHRYKGHALRKNIAAAFRLATQNGYREPWTAMFDAARASRPATENDLYPYWIVPDGAAKIERHVPALPHSREQVQQANLRRSLVLYRMVFGQNRQDDLLDYLVSRHEPAEVERLVEVCRIDLSPPSAAGSSD